MRSRAPFGRDSRFLDFVKQGAVADPQHARGAFAVPPRLLQRLVDHRVFGVLAGLLGELFQRVILEGRLLERPVLRAPAALLA